MLQDLSIQHFAIIENLQINFSPGFTVLTGETGAGKSIIIDALNLVLGGRASQDFIQTGEEEARIQAFFQFPQQTFLLEELEKGGIPVEDGLLFSRHLSLDGRNRSFVNGHRATLGQLKKLGSFLVEIHGQHHHQALLQKKNHLLFLDSFGGEALLEKKVAVSALFQQYQHLREEWHSYHKGEQERLQRIDLLTFQLQEIQKARLYSGEEEELRNTKKRLIGAEKLKEGVTASFHLLTGEDGEEQSILSTTGYIKGLLENAQQLDDTLQEMVQLVQTSYLQLQEASYLLRDYLEVLEMDPQQLQQVQDRLMQIGNLKRKYGPQVEDVLQYQEEMAEELESLQKGSRSQKALEADLAAAEKAYYQEAQLLRQFRQKAAKLLQEQMVSVLGDLKMEKVRFQVQFLPLEEPQATGLDQVQFLISPNPGEELKPLSRIASGGELSRIMLALKAGLAHMEGVATLLFDEIDSGVGGETAYRIGEKLASLAQDHQVICVTHLPQIAAMAHHHFFIHKEMKGEGTMIRIQELPLEERIQELARMLGGGEMTPTALTHAQELLSAVGPGKGGY